MPFPESAWSTANKNHPGKGWNDLSPYTQKLLRSLARSILSSDKNTQQRIMDFLAIMVSCGVSADDMKEVCDDQG